MPPAPSCRSSRPSPPTPPRYCRPHRWPLPSGCARRSPAPPWYKLQAPLPFATALPSSVAPSKTLTVALASAVPVSVSVLSLVMPSPTVPLSVENEAMVGADRRRRVDRHAQRRRRCSGIAGRIGRRCRQAVRAVRQRRRGISSRPRCRSPPRCPTASHRQKP